MHLNKIVTQFTVPLNSTALVVYVCGLKSVSLLKSVLCSISLLAGNLPFGYLFNYFLSGFNCKEKNRKKQSHLIMASRIIRYDNIVWAGPTCHHYAVNV